MHGAERQFHKREFRKKNASNTLMGTSSQFDCRMIKPCYQTSTADKFIASGNHRAKYIRPRDILINYTKSLLYEICNKIFLW